MYWRIGLRELKHPLASLLFWLKHDCKRNDIDGVVNANALYYLGNNDATKPIITYLMQVFTNQRERCCDSWYHSPINFYYAMGRNYNRGVREFESIRFAVLNRILTHQQADGSYGESLLETAQSLSALIYWQGPAKYISEAASILVNSQGEAGEWPRSIFFYSGPKKTVGWGSEELSTGFCLEALAAYQRWVSGSEARQ